jgi:hypothetical protein
MKQMTKLRRVGAAVAVALMAVAGSASAAGTGIDTSGVTSAITDAGAAVAVVGAAVLVLCWYQSFQMGCSRPVIFKAI